MKNGFSLIELAIALVIISLLTLGVLGAQSLIRGAENNSIIKSFSEIDSLTKSFFLEYDALPGDMADASVFPSYAGEPACSNDAEGDGDGKIEDDSDSASTLEDTDCEELIFWGHLQQANLYPDAEGVGFTISSYSTKSPESKLSGAFYEVGFEETAPENANYIRLGGVFSDDLKGAAIMAKRAYRIDKKTDDGNPLSGLLISKDGDDVSSQSCVTSGGAYQLASEDRDCVIYRILDMNY
jgi:prepilin-type N-terminal cleavage/methylation domain-containing protein